MTTSTWDFLFSAFFRRACQCHSSGVEVLQTTHTPPSLTTQSPGYKQQSWHGIKPGFQHGCVGFVPFPLSVNSPRGSDAVLCFWCCDPEVVGGVCSSSSKNVSYRGSPASMCGMPLHQSLDPLGLGLSYDLSHAVAALSNPLYATVPSKDTSHRCHVHFHRSPRCKPCV